MFSFKISCLVFMCVLTSLVHGQFSSLKQAKISETILLQFNTSQKLSEAWGKSGEEIPEEVKELKPNVIYYLHIVYIPAWVQFLVVQAHVYLHNVTLSYTIEKVPNKYVIGQNIGLVQNITANNSDAQFFLENSNSFTVTVLLTAVAYDKNAPVPGGCNLEFGVETAPWLQLNETGSTVAVKNQPARSPRVWGLDGGCDLPALNYQSYHLYLPEKDFSKEIYFEFLRKMITVSRIMTYGRKVGNSASEMLHVYSAYHGTGSVFALVVSASETQQAAYVPALSYSCSPDHYTETCQVLTSPFTRTLCALILFIGLFVCMFGHSFFQTELFLMSTLMGGIISYILIAPHGLSDSTNVLLASVGGVTVGNCWLLMWWVCGSPLLSVLMPCFSLAYLCSAIMFYTVFADAVYMQSSFYYWLVFACWMVFVSVMVAPQSNRVNILACSVVGSYAAIVPIDHYIGANLKYIFINTLRRDTVPGFNEAIIDPPFQKKDAILVGLWMVLAMSGFFLQTQRFGSRAPYPPVAQPWRPAKQHTPPVSEERPLLFGQSPGSDSVFT